LVKAFFAAKQVAQKKKKKKRGTSFFSCDEGKKIRASPGDSRRVDGRYGHVRLGSDRRIDAEEGKGEGILSSAAPGKRNSAVIWLVGQQLAG